MKLADFELSRKGTAEIEEMFNSTQKWYIAPKIFDGKDINPIKVDDFSIRIVGNSYVHRLKLARVDELE